MKGGEEGAKFSFLLAVPAILGGQFLESVKLWKGSSEAAGMVSLGSYAIGFFTSLVVGLFSVKAVFWIYKKDKLYHFGWYCLFIGIAAIILFHG